MTLALPTHTAWCFVGLARVWILLVLFWYVHSLQHSVVCHVPFPSAVCLTHPNVAIVIAIVTVAIFMVRSARAFRRL